MTSAERAAWRAAENGSSWWWAPMGATRMAAPLPQEPWPSKGSRARVRQSPPSRMRRRRRLVDGP
ncbi:hypothetical protein BJF79_28340 [Actinomadura sp. CNU-125]|nr:hypothetical protein BJF79_28340 [Actinomadura sp. CNU-125]